MNYISLNSYLRERFGCKVYKLAINGGFTCPNRDGKLDTRGCIFCSGYGSGDFAEDASLPVTEQIERGKLRVAGKMPKRTDMVPAKTGVLENRTYNNSKPDILMTGQDGVMLEHTAFEGKYIAYFQAFTNTYAPVERLRKLYMEAIGHPDVVALSIATRPDCLPEEVIELLSELNRIKPVWVELGLQTIHIRSAEYIRRGYTLSVYDEAVRNLKQRNIDIITHVILGLPGESRQDMLDTVRYVGDSGVQGIKLQLLHVIEGTDLADDYRAGAFECMSMEEYVELIRDCIEILPDDIVIHRMTGDGDKRTLIAPMWSADKKKVLNELNKALA